MNRSLAGVFHSCPRVGAKGATCGSKVAAAHLLTMNPPACPVCGRRITPDEIAALRATAGETTP